jgi:hypothetical protein
MNYPTKKEYEFYRSILRHAANLEYTLEQAETDDWLVDFTELLEYVMTTVDKINDDVLAIVMGQLEEKR